MHRRLTRIALLLLAAPLAAPASGCRSSEDRAEASAVSSGKARSAATATAQRADGAKGAAAGRALSPESGGLENEENPTASAAPRPSPVNPTHQESPPAPQLMRAPTPLRGEDTYFKHYGVNPTVDTAEEAVSTFGVDVDTASYSLMRSYLERSALPPEEAVRVEEFVNAFDYGYQAPKEGAFSIQAEAFPSPNRKGYHVLHIGLKGTDLSAAERKPANLVFVVDVSGSMQMENRLDLVKKSLHLLVAELGPGDSVGIVAYGTTARVALPPTTADHKDAILTAIDALATEGSTNAEAGLKLGYQMASEHLRPGGVNRLILCTDGVANTGATSAADILAAVKAEADKGITIATVGFGMGNYNDVLLEQLADKGNGNYHYVDKLDEARRVFVENLSGTLQVIAKDVKVQLEFNPRTVQRYRLLGYENRSLERREFDSDRVDAGEIGAGHAVTAIYEVRLASESGSLGKLRVRWKPPEGSDSKLIERDLPRDIVRRSLSDITPPARLSLVAAGFAEKLRGSYWARNLGYDDLLAEFERIDPSVRALPEVAELGTFIKRARELDRRGDKFEPELPIAKMDFDRIPVLK